MRDEKRIKRILNLLEELWTTTGTDQRFGQLLINNGIIPDSLYAWRMEDEILEKILLQWKKENQEHKA